MWLRKRRAFEGQIIYSYLMIYGVARFTIEFWRDDPNERRKVLFPFLWTMVAAHGQIFGNPAKDSVARVTNQVMINAYSRAESGNKTG